MLQFVFVVSFLAAAPESNPAAEPSALALQCVAKYEKIVESIDALERDDESTKRQVFLATACPLVGAKEDGPCSRERLLKLHRKLDALTRVWYAATKILEECETGLAREKADPERTKQSLRSQALLHATGRRAQDNCIRVGDALGGLHGHEGWKDCPRLFGEMTPEENAIISSGR
ncbi:MAG: hypothetical protein WCJ29_01625 [bacterium]